MLQAMVMSLGAIYAFIPIVIIIILIAAAAGLSRGTDIFQVFGIGALIGIGSSIGKGGTGTSIKGAGKSYGNSKAFKGMGTAAAKTIKGSGNKEFLKKVAAGHSSIINNFEAAASTGKIGGIKLSSGEKAALASATFAVSAHAQGYKTSIGRLDSAKSTLSQHINMAVVSGAKAPKTHGFIYGRGASQGNPKAYSNKVIGSYVSKKNKTERGKFLTWLSGGKKVTGGAEPRVIISLGLAATVYGAATSLMSRSSKDRLSRPADPNAFGSSRWGRVRQEALQKKLDREAKPFKKEAEKLEKNANKAQNAYHDAIVAELKKTNEGRELLRKIRLVSNPGYDSRAGMPPPPLKQDFSGKDVISGFKDYYFNFGRNLKSSLFKESNSLKEEPGINESNAFEPKNILSKSTDEIDKNTEQGHQKLPEDAEKQASESQTEPKSTENPVHSEGDSHETETKG